MQIPQFNKQGLNFFNLLFPELFSIKYKMLRQCAVSLQILSITYYLPFTFVFIYVGVFCIKTLLLYVL